MNRTPSWGTEIRMCYEPTPTILERASGAIVLEKA